MKSNSIGDIVAENMQQIVESESHHKMFVEPTPQIKIASDKCCNCDKCDSGCPCQGKCGKGCEICHSDAASADDGITAEAVKTIVSNLTRLSLVLDNLGLNRSSAKTLTALDNLISELALRKFAGPLTEIEVVDDPHTDDLEEGLEGVYEKEGDSDKSFFGPNFFQSDPDLPALGKLEDYLDVNMADVSEEDSNDISDDLKRELDLISMDHPDLQGAVGRFDELEDPETLFNPNLDPNTDYSPSLLAGDDGPSFYTDPVPHGEMLYGPTDYPKHNTLPSAGDTLIDELGGVMAELDVWIKKHAAEEEKTEEEPEAEEEEDFEDE
jgi:hypothetical protein